MNRNSLILALGILAAAPVFAQKTVPNPLAPDATASPATRAAAPAAPAAAPAKSGKPGVAPAAQAPGGGAGKVWVNTSSKVYHCEGSKYYGKTRKGEYMAEADARAKGFHGVNGKSCAAKS